MKTKVIIIDDDEVWRFLYRQLIKSIPEIEIIAEFEKAETALEQISHLCPDAAIVDFSLPGMTGREFADKMRKCPSVKVILASSHQQEHLCTLCDETAVFSIVSKDNPDKLLQDLKTLCKK
ncbi:MAG: response regulator transcription factor [Chitinivibrionales bacterium]|nr:response regulator transcription factor [Chitinivibrionales bacterium]